MLKIKIEFTKKSLKVLTKLDNKTKILILKAINNIPNGDIKPMQGYSDNIKRLRVGKYRVIYEIKNQILLILDIGSRGDIYK